MLTRYRALVTAHASVPDATVEAWLASAVAELNPTEWGTLYTDAVVWLAAHLYETQSVATAGPVSSRKTGALAETYAVSTTSPYASTAYGLHYLRLQGRLPGVMSV